jgi:REP element-mobilizing transposase RayT
MASFRSFARWNLAKRSKFRHDLAMAKYQTGSNMKHRLQYHLVWIPKYRRRVLRGKMVIRLRKLLYEACRIDNGYYVETVGNVDEDVVRRNIREQRR